MNWPSTHLWMCLDNRKASRPMWLLGVCPEEVAVRRLDRFLLCRGHGASFAIDGYIFPPRGRLCRCGGGRSHHNSLAAVFRCRCRDGWETKEVGYLPSQLSDIVHFLPYPIILMVAGWGSFSGPHQAQTNQQPARRHDLRGSKPQRMRTVALQWVLEAGGEQCSHLCRETSHKTQDSPFHFGRSDARCT